MNMNIIGRSGKAKRLGILGVLLLLPFGVATPAYASSPSAERNGCRVTFEPPIPVTSTSPKRIDYRVTARCGPNTILELKQRWAEDDTGIFDSNETGPWQSKTRTFAQSSGLVTVVLHYYANLPDTEGGPEEMFHEGNFRVKSGPLVGGWSGLLQSRNASISN